ncbi:hypothetical protein GDO78_020775 [Eleutherodactylus coqui]|uniref:Uncharacterized protein n=1 Tax=Eleutherodactylus coqui TaxID=57060 RepID=A0A8J6E8C8_ELECQ|nr:hypothetical protein GDO78_020775 [Eleutherodactylus coqui]
MPPSKAENIPRKSKLEKLLQVKKLFLAMVALSGPWPVASCRCLVVFHGPWPVACACRWLAKSVCWHFCCLRPITNLARCPAKLGLFPENIGP